MNIFNLDGWKKGKFKCSYVDSDLKVLEIKASWFHSQVEKINLYLSCFFEYLYHLLQL